MRKSTVMPRVRSVVWVSLVWALAFVSLGSVSGCSELSGFANTLLNNPTGTGSSLRPNPPQVAVSELRLVRSPNAQQIASYLCTQVAPAFVCGLLGPTPSQSDLSFAFNVELDVNNPNNIPLPLVEILAGFTAFPDVQGQRNLGAVCVSLCEDPNSCPQNAANACRSDSRDIRSLNDFAGATVNFLTAVATGQERFENLRIRTIAPNGHTRANLQLVLNSDMVLSLVKTLSDQAVQQVQRGQVPTFQIPYSLEGTVWVNVEHFGRFAASVPVYRGVWTIR